MKKILLFLLIGLVALPASAQKKFTFGPKVGFAVADLHADDDKMDDQISGVKTGLVAGVFAEYRPMKWFAVSADVLFARKGSEYELNTKTVELEQKLKNNYKLSYIDVPLLANFYVTRGLALKAGVQPSFLIAAKNKVSGTVNGEKVDDKVDLKDAIRTVDFAIPVGISYTFRMGLVLDVRYDISCTDLLKDGDYKLTNRVATLTVGWKF